MILRRLAGCWMLVLLIAAPWAMACIPIWAKYALAFAALAGVAMWAIACLFEQRWPRIPKLCLASVGTLLLYGWWMTLNAHQAYDSLMQRFVPITSWWPQAPGGVDALTGWEVMAPLTGILGMLLVACDLATERLWRQGIALAIALAGASVAIYGTLEKLAWVPKLVVPEMNVENPASSFGPFDYHGNAGAFLNLAMPLAFCGMVGAFLTRRDPLVRGLWTGLWIACVMGIYANISRGGMIVGTAELLVLGIWAMRQFHKSRWRHLGNWLWIPLVAGVLAATGFFLTFQQKRLDHFWGFLSDLSDQPRVLAWRISWAISQDAPIFGAGPGSFRLLFSQPEHWISELYSKWIITFHVPGTKVRIWDQAHQDYLQTLVEWGWVGLVIWGVLVVGAGMALARRLRKRGDLTVEDRCLAMGLTVALGGIYAHGWFDFPLEIVSLELLVGALLGICWQAPGWGKDASLPVT